MGREGRGRRRRARALQFRASSDWTACRRRRTVVTPELEAPLAAVRLDTQAVWTGEHQARAAPCASMLPADRLGAQLGTFQAERGRRSQSDIS